jgi:hypothetical protein
MLSQSFDGESFRAPRISHGRRQGAQQGRGGIIKVQGAHEFPNIGSSEGMLRAHKSLQPCGKAAYF